MQKNGNLLKRQPFSFLYEIFSGMLRRHRGRCGAKWEIIDFITSNLSIKLAFLPEDWKAANIMLVFKKRFGGWGERGGEGFRK